MVREVADPRLAMPQLPPRHVNRPRLLSLLDAAPDPPLTLLAAGPGAGKTVLLSEWARKQPGTAWITVTAAENEPTRFWRLFLSAVRTGRGSADELPQSIGDGAAALLESHLRRVPAPAAPLVLVIDDADVLTHPHILDGLDGIARGWYPPLRLVLAARSDPLLPLHRYRLAGRIRELRAGDLAMTTDEARALLAAHDVTLPDDALEMLTSRTEGWPAGIRLSALRMAGTDHPADFVAELALDQGSVGEYLINEVLARQPPQVRRLLIQTGFLDEVSGPLADAVTGLEGSAENLVELARTNSFVIPLDPALTRFRYHRLFAAILQHILRQQAQRTITALYSRTAAWHEMQGDPRTAMKWAAAAGDGRHVARLLARGGLAHAFVDRHDVPNGSALLALLDQTADEVPTAELRTARLALTAVTGGPGEASVPAEQIDDQELLVTVHLAGLILAEKRGDSQAVEAFADRLLGTDALRWLRAVRGLRAAVLLARARARFWDGHTDEVEELLERAQSAAVSDTAPAVELDVLGMIALVNTCCSRYARVDQATRQAHDLLRSTVNLTQPRTLDLAEALRAFAGGDLAAMTRAMRRAAAMNGMEWEPAATVVLAIIRALAFFVRGRYSAAQLILHDLPISGDGGPLMLAAYRDMMLASIETALGRPHGALRALRAYNGTTYAPIEIVRARAHMTLGEFREARDCIRHVVTGETSVVWRYLLVEALLCEAEIAQIERDSGRAVEVLVRAAEIADDDITFPFLRTTDAFAPLLERHPMLASRWPRKAGEPSDVSGALGTPRVSPFPETLTDRERAVLRLLATTMSTGEIAEELYVSVNTIKTHLAAIYRKLGARRRRDAVVRAREYEML